ncbi:hypothetical protein ACFXO9_25880 [Nocardia tengchongensis]
MSAADLVVNAVPDSGLVAEGMAMATGRRIMNLGTAPHSSARNLRIRAAQQMQSGAVLLNAGLFPGVMNLVVAELVRQYPEADEIEIAICLPLSGMSGPAGVNFVHENLTTIGRHGVYDYRSPRHATLAVPFPDPIGRKKCFGFAERDRGWISGVAGARPIRSYAYVDQRWLHSMILALNPLGLLPYVPKAPFLIRRRTVPQSPSAEPIVHWVSVKKNGVRLAARTVECSGVYRHAASASLVLAEGFLRAATHSGLTGCVNPEEIFSLGELEGLLAKEGIRVVPQDC